MSSYKIKEHIQRYETITTTSHLLTTSAGFLNNQELIELALDVSPIKATKLISKILDF